MNRRDFIACTLAVVGCAALPPIAEPGYRTITISDDNALIRGRLFERCRIVVTAKFVNIEHCKFTDCELELQKDSYASVRYCQFNGGSIFLTKAP